MKRGRGRGGRRPSNSSNSPNRTLESNGPDVKVRGTAHQICEKYQALARDAHASGERVAHESYLQHAEHYHRIILASQPAPNPDANQVSNDTASGDMEVPEENDSSDTTSNTSSNGSADRQSDANGTDAPRGTRARRGRRTRSERSNGQSNNNGDGSEAANAGSEDVPTNKASETSSDDSDAPAETA